jgi:geranylgeranyl pyrophosphate synthase
MGLDQAKQEVKMLIAEACDSLNELGSKAEGLRELAHYLISREK